MMGNYGEQKEQYCEASGESIIASQFKHDKKGRIKCYVCGRSIKTTPHPNLIYGQIMISPHKKPEYLKKI